MCGTGCLTLLLCPHSPLETPAHGYSTLYLAGPEWKHPVIRGGSPVNWPPAASWYDDYFPRDADDDAYAEVHPYGDGDQDHCGAARPGQIICGW